MTVVSEGDIYAYAKIPESLIRYFNKENQTVQIRANVDRKKAYKATLTALSKVPISTGNFRGTFKLNGAKGLYPGMKGKLY